MALGPISPNTERHVNGKLGKVRRERSLVETWEKVNNNKDKDLAGQSNALARTCGQQDRSVRMLDGSGSTEEGRRGREGVVVVMEKK